MKKFSYVLLGLLFSISCHFVVCHGEEADIILPEDTPSEETVTTENSQQGTSDLFFEIEVLRSDVDETEMETEDIDNIDLKTAASAEDTAKTDSGTLPEDAYTIEWGNFHFTFHNKIEKKWNPVTLSYDQTITTSEDDSNTADENNCFTITNHSGGTVLITATYINSSGTAAFDGAILTLDGNGSISLNDSENAAFYFTFADTSAAAAAMLEKSDTIGKIQLSVTAA